MLPHAGMLLNDPLVASHEMLPTFLDGPTRFHQPCAQSGTVKSTDSSWQILAFIKIDSSVWRDIIASAGEAEAGSAAEQLAKE